MTRDACRWGAQAAGLSFAAACREPVLFTEGVVRRVLVALCARMHLASRQMRQASGLCSPRSRRGAGCGWLHRSLEFRLFRLEAKVVRVKISDLFQIFAR